MGDQPGDLGLLHHPVLHIRRGEASCEDRTAAHCRPSSAGRLPLGDIGRHLDLSVPPLPTTWRSPGIGDHASGLSAGPPSPADSGRFTHTTTKSPPAGLRLIRLVGGSDLPGGPSGIVPAEAASSAFQRPELTGPGWAGPAEDACPTPADDPALVALGPGSRCGRSLAADRPRHLDRENARLAA